MRHFARWAHAAVAQLAYEGERPGRLPRGAGGGGSSSSSAGSSGQWGQGRDEFLRLEHFEHASRLVAPPSFAQVLSGISMPEVCLLVAMKRLEDHEFSTYNFQMAFAEYRKFVCGEEGSMSVHNYAKRVCFKAFEHLVDIELLKYVDAGNEMPLPDYRMVVLALDSETLLDALGDGTLSCSTEIQRWATAVLAQ